MQSSLQSCKDFDLLTLSGEIDLDYAQPLKTTILASLAAGNPLLIDLANVAFIDSSGIVTLVTGFQAAKSARLEYGLLNVSPAVMQVLTLTRLDRTFSHYHSVDQFQQQL